MMSALYLLIGLVVGFYGPVWLSDLFRYLQNRQILKDITPQEVNESRLCKGPHSWIGAQAFTDHGRETVQVCQVCGFMPSLKKMATTEAIDRIEENNRIREIQGKIFTDFQTQEDTEIKRYFDEEIKNGVSFDKLAHVHNAGMTFGARYNLYKASRAEEIDKAINRNDA
jgi:hypothetical protein